MKIFVSGDIANISSDNPNFIEEGLRSRIRDSDFALCNLEGPELLEGGSYQKLQKAGPCISQSSGTIQYLSETGFNIFCLANNHALDYGSKALENTMRQIERNKSSYIGTGGPHPDFDLDYKPKILTKNNIRIAIFNACESQEGADEWDLKGVLNSILSKKLEDEILRVRKQVDYVILISHAGLEHHPYPLIQWQKIYRNLCDKGVDIIVGHHPHIPQGIESYKESKIFYSLGNFYMNQLHFKEIIDESFSVEIDFSNTRPTYDIICHSKLNDRVKQVNYSDVNFCLENLSSILSNEQKMLEDSINISKYYFDKHILNYLNHSMSDKNTLKAFLKRILRRNKINDKKLLQHLFKVETNRFIILNALGNHD